MTRVIDTLDPDQPAIIVFNPDEGYAINMKEGQYLKNIFEQGELNEEVVVFKMEIPTQHGVICLFVSNIDNYAKMFVSYNVIIEIKLVDFYTNIYYTIFSTFKEDGLCTERLWAS